MLNNKRILTLIIIVLFINVSFSVFSSQTKLIGNYIKLVVTNNDGRFLLYGRNSINDDWYPLLFEDNPSTTFFKFFNNQFLIPFGQAGYGKYSDIDIIDDKIIYYWKNNKINIELDYQLIPSVGEKYADTLIIDLKIKSLNNWKFNIDYYFCIDTFLGESSKKHFIINDNDIIYNEHEYTNPVSINNISSYSKEKNLGINIDIQNEKITPDRIFFANWKRIDNSIGLYNVTEKRSFDLKPYSINDSAVGLEFRNKQIESNKEHINRFIIKLKNNRNTTDNISPDNNEIKKEEEPVYNSKKSDNSVNDNNNRKDLDDFNFDELLELLDNLNSKIRGSEPLIKEDVDFYNKLLEEIKNRRNKKQN